MQTSENTISHSKLNKRVPDSSDGSVEWYLNFGFDRVEYIGFGILITGLLVSLYLYLILPSPAWIVGIIVFPFFILITLGGRFYKVPKQVSFGKDCVRFQRYFFGIGEYPYTSIESILRDDFLSLLNGTDKSWYIVKISKNIVLNELFPQVQSEKIEDYGLRPEVGRMLKLLLAGEINYDELSTLYKEPKLVSMPEETPAERRQMIEMYLPPITSFFYFMIAFLPLPYYFLYHVQNFHPLVTVTVYIFVITLIIFTYRYKKQLEKELRNFTSEEEFVKQSTENKKG